MLKELTMWLFNNNTTHTKMHIAILVLENIFFQSTLKLFFVLKSGLSVYFLQSKLFLQCKLSLTLEYHDNYAQLRCLLYNECRIAVN